MTAAPRAGVPRYISLRVVVVALFLVALLPGVTIMMLSVRGTRNDLLREASEAASQTSRLLLAEITDQFRFAEAFLHVSHHAPNIWPNTGSSCETIFSEVLSRTPWLSSLWITDATGLQTCTYPATAAPLSRADRPDFRRAMAQLPVALGEPQVDRTTGLYEVPMSVAIFDAAGRTIGTVGTAIRLSAIKAARDQISLPENTVVAIISADGTILYRDPVLPDLIGRPALPGTPAQVMMKATADAAASERPQRLQFDFAFANGTTRQVTATYAPTVRLWSAVAVDRANLTAAADRRMLLDYALIASTLGLAMLGTLFGLDRAILSRLRGTLHELRGTVTGLPARIRRRPRFLTEIDELSARMLKLGRAAYRRKQAQREANMRLRSILQNAVDGLIMINELGLIMVFNRTAEQIFGYSRTEVIGRNVKMLMPEPYHSAHDNYLSDYLQTGFARIISKGRTVEGRRKDGSVFPMDLAVARIPDFRGRQVFLGTVRDVSDRLRVEAQLRESQKMEALGQLTGGIAHDFNNLLAVILGNLEVVGDHITGNDSALKAINGAVRAADSAANLTRQLLAFARRMPLRPQLIDVNKLLADALDMYGRTLGEMISFEAVLKPGQLCSFVDPALLQVAILNLALNARDAMPRGGKLTIRTETRSVLSESGEPSEQVLVSVTDNGTGMTPEVLARATEPFFTTKGVGAGTGLGLSMVHGFVTQSGGSIRLESKPGHGTTVFLHLPKVQQETVELDSDDRDVAETPVAASTTVLVVEDAPEVRRIVTSQLEHLGYSVLLAENGDQAVDLVRSSAHFDILLTDVVMPGKTNGFDVAHATKTLRPDVGIVCMSGYTNPLRGADTASMAEFGVLPKPFTRAQLARALRQAARPATAEG